MDPKQCNEKRRNLNLKAMEGLHRSQSSERNLNVYSSKLDEKIVMVLRNKRGFGDAVNE